MPNFHPFIRTVGMPCCRFQRISIRAISDHSRGKAIDLKLHEVLDARGNDRVPLGLTLIAPLLNRHGWYWGAAFSTEDAMHFEASQALVTKRQARLRRGCGWRRRPSSCWRRVLRRCRRRPSTGPTECRFTVPPDWRGMPARWTEKCLGQCAEGLGILRIYDGVQVRAFFYGEMTRGEPRMGVIGINGGDMAERFADGALIETDDRNLLIRAFRVASAAAHAASEQFRAQGNTASTRCFAAAAERLASPMD